LDAYRNVFDKELQVSNRFEVVSLEDTGLRCRIRYEVLRCEAPDFRLGIGYEAYQLGQGYYPFSILFDEMLPLLALLAF
jgi:hypothetical protein